MGRAEHHSRAVAQNPFDPHHYRTTPEPLTCQQQTPKGSAKVHRRALGSHDPRLVVGRKYFQSTGAGYFAHRCRAGTDWVQVVVWIGASMFRSTAGLPPMCRMSCNLEPSTAVRPMMNPTTERPQLESLRPKALNPTEKAQGSLAFRT